MKIRLFRPRFSLKLLLLLVLLAALLCRWVAGEIRPLAEQQRALRVLDELVDSQSVYSIGYTSFPADTLLSTICSSICKDTREFFSRIDSFQLEARDIDVGFGNKPANADDLLRVVSRLPYVESLKLTGTRVTAHTIRRLAIMPALRSVWLSDCEFTEDAWHELGSLQELSALTFNCCGELARVNITDVCSALPNLESLMIWNTSLAASAGPDQRIHRKLKALDLTGYVDDQLLSVVCELPELEYLFINGDVTDKGLSHVSSLVNLKSLYLDGTDATDRGLRHLAGLKKLETLDLSGIELHGPGLVELWPMVNLHDLNLAWAELDDAGVSNIVGLKGLRKLTLWGTSVTDAGLPHLLRLPELQELNLEDTRVSDEGIVLLAGIPTLMQVYVRGTKVTPAGMDTLRKRLPQVNVQDWSAAGGGSSGIR